MADEFEQMIEGDDGEILIKTKSEFVTVNTDPSEWLDCSISLTSSQVTDMISALKEAQRRIDGNDSVCEYGHHWEASISQQRCPGCEEVLRRIHGK